jgi:hypothetical protein
MNCNYYFLCIKLLLIFSNIHHFLNDKKNDEVTNKYRKLRSFNASFKYFLRLSSSLKKSIIIIENICKLRVIVQRFLHLHLPMIEIQNLNKIQFKRKIFS